MALEDSKELYLAGNDIRNTPCFNDYKHGKILKTVHFNQIMILNSVEINFRAHRVFNKIVFLISETFSGKKIGNMVCDCYCNYEHVMSSSNV